MTTCNDIGPRIASMVQNLNTVHNLVEIKEYKRANELLGMLQARLQTLSHDVWLEYHVSGSGK